MVQTTATTQKKTAYEKFEDAETVDVNLIIVEINV